MSLLDTLHQRQYKISLSDSVLNLDLPKLAALGNWSNPKNGLYILTIKYNDKINSNLATFEKKFREITGLTSNDYKIEARYSPYTLQSAVDSPWF